MLTKSECGVDPAFQLRIQATCQAHLRSRQREFTELLAQRRRLSIMCNDKRWAETSGLKIECCILGGPPTSWYSTQRQRCTPLRPIRRVVDEVTARLIRSSMITVKTFTPCEHGKAWGITTANYLEDAGADIHRICYEGSEPLDPLTEWMLNECEVNIAKVESTLQ